ncbi:MAG: hypothetical protein ABIQ90_10410 [Polaromonas sp.]
MTLTDRAWFTFAALIMALPTQTHAQTSPVGLAAGGGLNSAGFDKPVALTTLEENRGGTQVVFNDMQLAGTTAGNSATHVMTGTNDISAGAFANMSGLPVVIQNSGANVLIQNAIILNLQMN